MTNALVLLSGGQDSTTCLLDTLSLAYDEVSAVSFDYGQRHRVELGQARHILDVLRSRTGRALPHYVLQVPALRDLADAALTSPDIAVEATATSGAGNEYAARHGLPSTFVPARNAMLLATAAALAAKLDAPTIVTGICEADDAGYPDCREAFRLPMEAALRAALDWPELELAAPLMNRTKAETWKLAWQAAGEWGIELVRQATHTCYEGERRELHDYGYGCDRCPACHTRAAGWREFVAHEFNAGALA
jgi:7-cyano-7-deazaguanine synthase